MSKSSEVVGGGTLAATAAAVPEVSVAALVEEGRGGTPLEDAPRGPEGSQVSSPLSKKGST